MKRVTLVRLFVNNQDEALEFYTKKLGFEVAEDSQLAATVGCWCACLPTKSSVSTSMLLNRRARALVGRQPADMPLFSIETDDCMSEYRVLKERGVEFEGEPEVRSYGTGVLVKDLYGNKIYINQD